MSPASLFDSYDALLADLDGTLLLAGSVIDHAPAAWAAARAAGLATAIVTNNASRSPETVAQRLSERGFAASATDVITSPQAAAALLAETYPADSAILVLGADALAHALAEAGLRAVHRADDHPVAVAQGFSPDIGWHDLAEACVAIRNGARWVATNTDATLPTDRGELPGNGALVQCLVTATGASPDVAGKPERALIDTAAERAGSDRPLVVGDRLETDIAAARHAGVDSLMVLTGASTIPDVLATERDMRPTYVAADLRGLTDPGRYVRLDEYDDDPVLRDALDRIA